MLEGARPALNQIMRFLDAFAPGKSIAALRIPRFCRTPYSTQGNIHRAAGALEGQDPPRIGLYGFSGAMCRTKLLPRSVFHHKGTSTEQRECPRCKTRLESNYAVFQAQCAEQSFCRASYSAQGNIHRTAGVLEGARPTSNWILRFSPANAGENRPGALAPGRPRNYGNGGCSTHMTARC